MYAEHNDSCDPERDWELSVEFHADEQAEYAFYVSQGSFQVCSKSALKRKEKASSKIKRPRVFVHKHVLQRTCY
jgi:hypothetical protein